MYIRALLQAHKSRRSKPTCKDLQCQRTENTLFPITKADSFVPKTHELNRNRTFIGLIIKTKNNGISLVAF